VPEEDKHRDSVMVTVKLDPGADSLTAAAMKLGLPVEALDQDYGAVCIDPTEQLYVVLADRETAERAQAGGGAEGVFSNPKIEPI
jgi:hypothetical protein